MIDLHTHSSASDGTDRPKELVANAAVAGLSVLAITDHDTTSGWAEAAAALPRGLTLLPGAEFSCVHVDLSGREVSLHLLGYLFDPEHEGLRQERARLRASRLGRGEQIVNNLAADGYPVTWERVTQLAAGGAVGRPHIARVLVENHVVNSVNEAFAELLAADGKYYSAKVDTDVFAAIDLIRAAGGLTVFAHPFARQRGPVVGIDVIAAMSEAGLDGIEVDHPDHVEPDRLALRGIADDLHLVRTGSSDYHGTNKTTPLAACTTDPAQYEALIARTTARMPIKLSA